MAKQFTTLLPTRPNSHQRWEGGDNPPPSLRAAVQSARGAAQTGDAETAWRHLLGSTLRRQLWLWLWVIVLSVICYGVVSRFVFTAVVIQGRSMLPTLQEGQHYLLNRWMTYCHTPERGDVVVIRDPGHTDLAVKRIVGLPGDTIRIAGGCVFINGRRLEEPYLRPGTRTFMPGFEETSIHLGPAQYYVLGDNRQVSEDSRYYGPVTGEAIVGYLRL